MQVLKEDVRNKIIDAAVEEFLINGFENSSLRTIAAQAGITIGNIYSYFSSKEALFNQVVSPAADALDELMAMDFVLYKDSHATNLTEIAKKICGVFVENKERFFILINENNGSRFGNTRESIVNFISKRIKTELFPRLSKPHMDPLFSTVLAVSLLSGFLTIFTQYGGDEDRLMSLINDLLGVFLGDIGD